MELGKWVVVFMSDLQISDFVGTSCWNKNCLTEVLFKCPRLNSCICNELKPVNTLTRGQSRSNTSAFFTDHIPP
jgi:hypothetical protein